MHYEIIDSREDSGATDCWTLYLCVAIKGDRTFVLYNGRYDYLADAEDYLNEETGDYDLPAEIGGVRVVEIQDDWIVGGDPIHIDDGPTLEFADVADPRVSEWLVEQGWASPLVAEKLRLVLRRMSKSARNRRLD